jgi:hypothetical protein
MGIADMENNSPSNFKIRLDDDNPEAIFKEEMDDLRIEKLSQRLTIMTILVPILIGVILFIAYFDIKNGWAPSRTPGHRMF